MSVPSAVDGWFTLLKEYGTMTMAQVLEPAIHYAENGFAVSEIIARAWAGSVDRLKRDPSAAATWLIDGERAPKVGEVFVNKDLANTFKKMATGGRDAFYKGSIARAIIYYSDELI